MVFFKSYFRIWSKLEIFIQDHDIGARELITRIGLSRYWSRNLEILSIGQEVSLDGWGGGRGEVTTLKNDENLKSPTICIPPQRISLKSCKTDESNLGQGERIH